MTTSRINIAVAHRLEARPLIEHLGLERRPASRPFECYVGEQVNLAITGQGREAMAAAVGYLHGVAGSEDERAWLNIGVAGHRRLSLGSVVLADRVVDPQDRVDYPVFAFRRPCPTSPLYTVDEPEREYPANALYDMEGSAFYAAATRMATRELVHVLKIVSDNRDQPTFDRRRTTELIVGSFEVLDLLLARLGELIDTLSPRSPTASLLPTIAAGWHLTHSHRLQVTRALEHLGVLQPQLDVWAEIRHLDHARDVVAHLEQLRMSAAMRGGLGRDASRPLHATTERRVDTNSDAGSST